MHIILAIAGIAVAAYVWINRAKHATDVTGELLDVASDVKNAARRFGFRRRTNQHPVDAIDDPTLAVGGLAMAFLELDDLPTADARAKTDLSLRKHLNLTGETAQEVAVLGRWLVEQCGGPSPAVPRLSKRLKALADRNLFDPLMAILRDVVQAGGGTPSARQSEALEDVARVFRLQ